MQRTWSHAGATGGQGTPGAIGFLLFPPCSSGCHGRQQPPALSCCQAAFLLGFTETEGIRSQCLCSGLVFYFSALKCYQEKWGVKHICFWGLFCCIKCLSSIFGLEGTLRPEAFKCCGQRFATSTAQSCAALPLHELPVTRARRMQSPNVPAVPEPPCHFHNLGQTSFQLFLPQY